MVGCKLHSYLSERPRRSSFYSQLHPSRDDDDDDDDDDGDDDDGDDDDDDDDDDDSAQVKQWINAAAHHNWQSGEEGEEGNGEERGQLHILVNCAALFEFGQVEEVTEAQWERVLGTLRISLKLNNARYPSYIHYEFLGVLHIYI